MICLKLTPRDPVIARDGRPFGLGVGRHVKTVQWPYPSVLAGSLRTLMGKLDGGTFNEKRIKKLKEMNITGPFPTKNGELFVPAPKDIMFYVPKKNGGKGEFKLRYLVKRPFTYGNGEGCDLPDRSRARGSYAGPGRRNRGNRLSSFLVHEPHDRVAVGRGLRQLQTTALL